MPTLDDDQARALHDWAGAYDHLDDGAPDNGWNGPAADVDELLAASARDVHDLAAITALPRYVDHDRDLGTAVDDYLRAHDAYERSRIRGHSDRVQRGVELGHARDRLRAARHGR